MSLHVQKTLPEKIRERPALLKHDNQGDMVCLWGHLFPHRNLHSRHLPASRHPPMEQGWVLHGGFPGSSPPPHDSDRLLLRGDGGTCRQGGLIYPVQVGGYPMPTQQ